MPLETALNGIPADVLSKAFKTQSLIHHPDKNPGDDAAALRFRKVKAAFLELDVPPGTPATHPKRSPANYWAKLYLWRADDLAF